MEKPNSFNNINKPSFARKTETTKIYENTVKHTICEKYLKHIEALDDRYRKKEINNNLIILCKQSTTKYR